MTYHLFITNKNYTSWSLRPWLLLRELNIPFVEELRPIDSGSFRQPRTYLLHLPTCLDHPTRVSLLHFNTFTTN